MVKMFKIGNDSGEKVDSFINLPDKGYYRILFDGKRKVYIKEKIIIKAGQAPDGYNTRSTKDQYVLAREYYVKESNSDLLRISLKKKKILTFFGDRSQQIARDLKEKNLTIASEEGLKEAFIVYESYDK